MLDNIAVAITVQGGGTETINFPIVGGLDRAFLLRNEDDMRLSMSASIFAILYRLVANRKAGEPNEAG